VKISPTGEYLVLGDSSGGITTWETSEELSDNINEILFAMNEDPYGFWRALPIYLPD